MLQRRSEKNHLGKQIHINLKYLIKHLTIKHCMLGYTHLKKLLLLQTLDMSAVGTLLVSIMTKVVDGWRAQHVKSDTLQAESLSNLPGKGEAQCQCGCLCEQECQKLLCGIITCCWLCCDLDSRKHLGIWDIETLVSLLTRQLYFYTT